MKIAGRFGSYYKQWLQRRIPPQREQTLSQRQIFIFPSGYGFFFLSVAAALFIGGINYENNLMMGFCFLMVALFLVSILHTFKNMSGLQVRVHGMRSGFALQQGAIEVQFVAPSHGHFSILASYPGMAPISVSLAKGELVTRLLSVTLPQRGWVRPGRLRLESDFPLGLIRSWSLLDLDQSCLAWPNPLPGGEPQGAGAEEDSGDRQRAFGAEEFEGLREYAPGDSLRSIDWKSLARGRGLNTKQFSEPAQGIQWLEWNAFVGLAHEDRIRRICFWVLELGRQGKVFGLRLPGVEIPLGSGERHQIAALNALAELPGQTRQQGRRT